MRRYIFFSFISICFSALIPLGSGFAASPQSLVSKGNSAYNAGKYDEALSAYNEASVQMPESPRIYFDKGAALYRKKDYGKAMEMFEKAALKTRDIGLEARAKFNLGNCSFGEAERRRDSDINKALEACEKSIHFYQEALDRDSDLKEAAENIEIVRLTMKTILDEIKKQKENAKKRQEAGEKLKKLIKRQSDLLNRNQDLSKGRQSAADHKDKVKTLADDQDSLRKETLDIAKDMHGRTRNPPSPDPAELAKKHLENASKEQGAASEKMRRDRLNPASEDQQKAIDEMKEALKSLGENRGNKGGKEGQQQQNAGKKGTEKRAQQEEQAAVNNQRKADKMKGEKHQSFMARSPDDAQSILDEEKENMKHRRLPHGPGYREVDKDW